MWIGQGGGLRGWPIDIAIAGTTNLADIGEDIAIEGVVEARGEDMAMVELSRRIGNRPNTENTPVG